MLNPIWLDTFITLVETGHFTRTAEQRFMTQPGVSQHLKKLEETCGCELVIRLGKGIQLTEQGRRVFEYAKAQQQQEQNFIASLKFDEPYEGKCIVACSGAIAQRIYPALVALQAQHTALNIHLEVAPRRTILSGITNGTFELGIVTNMPNTEDVSCTYLGEEPLGLILPSSYLTQKGERQGKRQSKHSANNIVDTLNALGLINHPDAVHYLQRYIKDSGEADLALINPNKLKYSGYVNQLSQILIPVSKGLGFTVLPSSTLEFVNVANELVMYTPKNDVAEPLYCVQAAHAALPARYNIVKNVVKDVIKDMVKKG
ncbi:MULTISPECIES: LysR family transcriptional regulator [unclassified Alteromonas]|uniref:LysR family transcriptional regulator n=1 Tax=unclassified Alteromonas TaxID=2614992 RepID=UPI000509469F|nr:MULTISPECIES: LysR family transcriptional regulator [unclassified Alteromonas]